MIMICCKISTNTGIIARGIVQQPGIDASPHLQGQRRAFRYALFAQALHAGPCAQVFRGQPPSLYQHAVGQQMSRLTVERHHGLLPAQQSPFKIPRHHDAPHHVTRPQIGKGLPQIGIAMQAYPFRGIQTTQQLAAAGAAILIHGKKRQILRDLIKIRAGIQQRIEQDAHDEDGTGTTGGRQYGAFRTKALQYFLHRAISSS